MNSFTARTSWRFIDVGAAVTFIPETHDPKRPPPPVPPGIVVPLAADHATMPVKILAATRHELLCELPDGRTVRLTPQNPTERGGYYEPDRGMSVWVVRAPTG